MFPTIVGDETDIKKWMADMIVRRTIVKTQFITANDAGKTEVAPKRSDRFAIRRKQITSEDKI